MTVLKCLSWTTRLDKILEEVHPGDLVRFHRGLFIHHAVYVGRSRAVHHHLGPKDGEVIEATMEYLAKGDLMKVIKVADLETPFSPREVIRRARSQIGPRPYSLPDGNCEHFTTWVYHDVKASRQLNGLCQYELSLLRIVKHRDKSDGQQEQQLLTQQQAQATQRMAEQVTQLHTQQELQTQQHPLRSQHVTKRQAQIEEEPQTTQQTPQQQELATQLQAQIVQQLQTQQQSPTTHQATQQQAKTEHEPQTSQQPSQTEHHETQMHHHEASCNRTNIQTDTNENPASGEEDDGFVFIPPRPIKYRHTKNPAQIACNHARSCLKVLTVQAVLGLAAVPLYRCSLQADNLQKLGRRLTSGRRRKPAATMSR